LSIFSRIKSFHLLHLSQPASDRPLYRTIGAHGFRRIVELGIGDCQRAIRMIQTAAEQTPAGEIHYIGLDRFEAGNSGQTLKQAYRLLRATGARVQLLPGEPADALMQHANELGKLDLLLLSELSDWESSPRLWFYVPRLLDEGSEVYIERRDGQGQLAVERVERAQLRARAEQASLRRAA
jgi:hypothetical protein